MHVLNFKIILKANPTLISFTTFSMDPPNKLPTYFLFYKIGNFMTWPEKKVGHFMMTEM